MGRALHPQLQGETSGGERWLASVKRVLSDLPARKKEPNSVTRATVVMIGAGAISDAWFQVLDAEQVEVLAVVDVLPELASRLISKYGVAAEAFADFRDALRRYQPDFVLDLTAPTARLAIAEFALAAGFHVLAEKPMATSMDDARRIVAASEKYGRLTSWANRDALTRTPTPPG